MVLTYSTKYEGLRNIAQFFSTFNHMLDFSRGLIDSRYIIFYTLSSIWLLYSSISILKWKLSVIMQVSKKFLNIKMLINLVLSFVLLIILFFYANTFIFRIDLNNNSLYDLSPRTLSVLNQPSSNSHHCFISR